MARKYFGTDGIRGQVGIAPITPDFGMRLGITLQGGEVRGEIGVGVAEDAHESRGGM